MFQGVLGNTGLNFRKNNGGNQRKYIILHIDEHQVHFYSRSSGDALSVKMYSTYIFQYPGMVVKVFIKVRKIPIINLN